MQARTKKMVMAVIGLVAVMLVAGGGVALATHSNPNEIHACYNNSGHLVIVDDPANCGNNETAISWNQEGPTGPQGLQGNPGPAGPTGPQGLSGLSDVEMVFSTSPLANDSFVAILLPCPSGKQVVSGGFDIMSPGNGVIEIVTSAPYNFGWHVRARASANFQDDLWQLRAFALCATST